jgi:uncharacterized RDD family membrane protein YckC
MTETQTIPQATGLNLPEGVVVAGVGRRIGAYFLSLVLLVVTLGIGYLIWGLIVWGKGTSPALQVLGMKVWKESKGKRAGWGTMFLRNVVGGIVQGFLGFITGLISFILFLTDDEGHRSIQDRIGGTIVVRDPNKVLG